jgi:hypothetical protein
LLLVHVEQTANSGFQICGMLDSPEERNQGSWRDDKHEGNDDIQEQLDDCANQLRELQRLYRSSNSDEGRAKIAKAMQVVESRQDALRIVAAAPSQHDAEAKQGSPAADNGAQVC